MTDAPWWGVPVIAGTFLIIGGVLTYIFNYANDRRKRVLEDRRRFETEIIELYEKLDDAVEGLHNNAGATDVEGLQKEKDEHFRLYLQILRAWQRLKIIAARELSRIAAEMRIAAIRLEPDYKGEYANAMADLVDSSEYFRGAYGDTSESEMSTCQA